MWLTVFGLGAIGFGLNSALKWVPSGEFEFAELTDPAGFRRLSGSSVSATSAVLAGLETAPRPAFTPTAPFCDMLFGPSAKSHPAIAVFTDVNCPVCRRFEPELEAAAARASLPLSVTYHEFPRLSPSSEVAARAALAAGFQGAYPAFHERLMRTRFQPTNGYIAALADGLNLDAEKLLQDMNDPAVDQSLAQSAYLAGRIGVPGTPTFVIGRTIVVGALDAGDLDRLIRLESDLAPVC